MSKERATKAQLQERHDTAAELLSRGWPPARIVQVLADEYNVSPQQARDYVREGKALMLSLLDDNDIKFEFYSCLNDLKQDRLNAINSENYAAAVGATKARVKLLEQLPTIDPAGCWNAQIQQEFNSFVEDRLAPPTGKIPKERIMKKSRTATGKDLDIMDAQYDPVTGLEIDQDTGNFIYHPEGDSNNIDELPF